VKSQSVSEYILILAVISLALLAMQTYTKRGLQGTIKFMADELGKQDSSATLGYTKSIASFENTQTRTQTKSEKIASWEKGSLKREVNLDASSSGISSYVSIGDE